MFGTKRKKRWTFDKNFDKTSFKWLDENYKRIYGLRNWTWKTIMLVIRNEHLQYIKEKGDSELDAEYVHIIWDMFLKFGGVLDDNRVPVTNDPEHNDVMLLLNLYSLDSFIFSRLNEGIREKKVECIANLGPFAVGISRMIDDVQRKR